MRDGVPAHQGGWDIWAELGLMAELAEPSITHWGTKLLPHSQVGGWQDGSEHPRPPASSSGP